MKKKNNSNQFGFTLAEVMVAAGLIGVLSLAVVNMIGNINRTSKRASQVFNIQQEIQRISGILADEDSCLKTFNGQSFGSTANGSSLNFNQIRRSTGPNPGDVETIYTLDQELGGTDGVVHIESMSATTTSNPGPVYLENGVNVTKVDASIRVTFQKGRAGADIDAVKRSSVGMTDVSRDFPLSFVLNSATGAVVSCYGSASQYTDAVCDALGGDIDANGDCVQVTLKSRSSGTPNTQVPLDYSAEIGSNTAAAIVNTNTANTPLRIHRGGTNAMRLDEANIQTEGLPLSLNPYGRVEIAGNTGSSAINDSTPANAPLRVNDSTSRTLTFDGDDIQVTTGGGGYNLGLNPYGPSVTVGRSGQTSHLNVYGNINVGDPTALVTTRAINLYDGSYINFLSDESVKDDVVILSDVLDKLEAVKGVSFVWKDTGRKDIGYIAQDLEKVFPEVVERDSATGLLNVQYTKMPAVNTAAIKELKRENDELKFRVNLLMKALCNGEDAYKYEEVCSIPVAPLE